MANSMLNLLQHGQLFDQLSYMFVRIKVRYPKPPMNTVFDECMLFQVFSCIYFSSLELCQSLCRSENLVKKPSHCILYHISLLPETSFNSVVSDKVLQLLLEGTA